MKFAKLRHMTKEKCLSKNPIKSVAWKLVPDPFSFLKSPQLKGM